MLAELGEDSMPAASNLEDKRSFDALRLLSDIVRRYGTLVARISSAELLADAIAFDLARLEDYFKTGVFDEAIGNYNSAGRGNSAKVKDHLRRMAEAGVLSLEIKTRADDLADVRIDGGKQFTLPPMLADLLYTLSIDSGPSEDEIVGWKRLDEVAILLTKRMGRRFTRHSVTQNIYRLRQELFNRAGANPFLIQTNKRRGVRFALRRKRFSVIENDRR
ncbi:MAG: hypothetical protein M3R69_04985 [Acidobacteriota bacterium]|nr:hypothetical protein [Acidobacteriota bacterium]